MSGEGVLITSNEAESVAEEVRHGRGWRTLLVVVSAASMIITATLLIMVLLSLRGARTGLEAIFPFLDNRPSQDLQLPVN